MSDTMHVMVGGRWTPLRGSLNADGTASLGAGVASAGSVTNASATVTGTAAALPAAACNAIRVVNTASGAVDIEYRRGGSGVAIPIPAGAEFPIIGLTNASQIDLRRVSGSGSGTVFYEVFAA